LSANKTYSKVGQKAQTGPKISDGENFNFGLRGCPENLAQTK